MVRPLTLSRISTERAEKLASDVRSSIEEQDSNRAAALLGSSFNEIASQNAVQMLGRYTQALLASGGNMEELLPFLQNFLKGYGDYGVLIMTRTGLQSWRAAAQNNQVFTNAPKGRVYVDDAYVVIPFSLGQNFVTTIAGSGKSVVNLWKIIPQGINTKHYPAGNWDKEITVYTERLLPPGK